MIEAVQHRQLLLPAPPVLTTVKIKWAVPMAAGIRQAVTSGMECQECDSDFACLDMKLKYRDLTDMIEFQPSPLRNDDSDCHIFLLLLTSLFG